MQIAQLTLTDAFKVLFSVRQVQAAENGDCTWRGRRRARQSPPRCRSMVVRGGWHRRGGRRGADACTAGR
ncbi:hypothetical protein XFF6990_200418 [Xanthomonas citri pv. fuscans]|uniref:Uncharacterized protein n=1 Tax=Xanthomonas campestris pv. phaseoli TaxID=317013 RepID=A0A7Z7J3Q4_XANCH|nr:hypothetical protein XFF6990_200418 [Xanthomonas citri pv. fuscans]SOO25651.1 hypothetical protein XFF6991_470044 [Xanthomonas phaseoli pv. phaseoli]